MWHALLRQQNLFNLSNLFVFRATMLVELSIGGIVIAHSGHCRRRVAFPPAFTTALVDAVFRAFRR